MPLKTNLNVNPYYEDFDASKNFYKILFRPGYSIQSRELTQIQSILQNQLESFGKYAFKQGELVIPGEVGLNTKLDYVKLSSVSEVAISEGDDIVYKKYDISQLVGQRLVGLTSGVTATILTTSLATESSADTLFVSYVNSGNSNTESTFRQGETLEVVDGVNTPLLVVGTDGSVLPTSIQVTNPDTGETTSLESSAMGYGSAVKVEEGIYFVNGYFVRNDEQLLVIDEYYDKPSAKVGFTIKEEIITPEADVSLYDNAIGSSNYTAPGAHRLKIGLEIKEFALGAITDKNFIQLLTVKRGVVQRKVTPSDFSVLEQTLARRTFDESGDYVVDNFSVDVREWAQKDNNKGIYAADEFGLYNGYTAGEASRKMVASIGPGKAYVRGYDIETISNTNLDVPKARTTKEKKDIGVDYNTGSQFIVNRAFGAPNVGLGTTSYVSLRSQRIGVTSETAAGTEIGKAKVYNFTAESVNLKASDQDQNEWDLRLFDIQTYTTLGISTDINISLPARITGDSSGAEGFLVSAVSGGTELTLYGNNGNFVKDESFKVNGNDVGPIIKTIKDYGLNDVFSVYSNPGVGQTFNEDIKLSQSTTPRKKSFIGTTPTITITGSVANPTVSSLETLIIAGQTIILGPSGLNLNAVISDINDAGVTGLVASKNAANNLVLTYTAVASTAWTVVLGAGTANTNLGLTAQTYTASNPDSVAYYNVWSGTVADRAKSDQMNQVVKYFENLGYTIERLKNTTTNKNFKWVISY